MAITEEHKKELVAAYQKWLQSSQAVILAEYRGLTMSEMDALRSKTREAGGEFHVVKNTLAELAFEKAGYPVPPGLFTGSTAVGFAFTDSVLLAKALVAFAKTSEAFKIKGGYLEARPLKADQIKELAELPPLPVIRARLMGTILASASQLVRTFAEPARQVAAVIKVHAEKEPSPASA